MVSKCRVVVHSYIFIVVSLLLGMDHGYPANFLGNVPPPPISLPMPWNTPIRQTLSNNSFSAVTNYWEWVCYLACW